jgi:nifR3 family TIM-barrel protein
MHCIIIEYKWKKTKINVYRIKIRGIRKMQQYIHKLKIGDVELENNLILAPMAGITDLAFRKICEEYMPGLVCTEMVSAKAIMYGDEKTKLLLNTEEEKRPISMQIFGSDVEAMKIATRFLNDKADIIDINMGCPAPKVVKNGDGSKLLLDLKLAGKIVSAVVKESTHPVTVKFRKGWDKENIVATEAGKIFEQAGASAIIIHGRTRTEYYSGVCDIEIIKKVKESVKIPVIGNGDIIDGESAKRMFEYTGVDGIMIGRASIGNPFIFQEIKNYFEGKEIKPISNEIKLKTILKHLEIMIKLKGEKIGIKEMRKHLSAYIKGMPNSSEAREMINKIENRKELEEYLYEFLKK